MWFGDLVTMRWWNGIWLNEAFATFMSLPLRRRDGADLGRCSSVPDDPDDRVRGGRAREHAPDRVPGRSPDDASGMFDILTYTKGGAVLRMIEQWLGAGRVPRRDPPLPRRARVRRTPRRTTCGTRSRRRAGSRSGGSWTPGSSRGGTRRSRSTLDGDAIRLTQRRFAPSLPDDETTWPVPLIVRQVFPDGERAEHVLVEAGGLTVPLAHPEALVVANAGSSAFVRTFYDDELRSRLTARHADLTPGERQSLLDDAWAAAVAGRATVSSFLDVAAGFAGETAPSVWQTIITGLAWCDRFLDGPPRERFRDYVRTLVRPALDRLGWDPRTEDGELDRELRGDLIRTLGVLGDDPETQAMAREAEALSRTAGGVDASVAAAAVEVVAFAGGEEAFEAFRARMQEAPTPQEQDRYRYALARFRDPALMERLLALAVSEEIRPAGRAVPAGACRGEPGPRGDGVAPRPRPLGRAVAALRGLQRDPPGAGRPPDHRPGAGRRDPGVLRRARHPAEPPLVGAGDGTTADDGRDAGTRGRRARDPVQLSRGPTGRSDRRCRRTARGTPAPPTRADTGRSAARRGWPPRRARRRPGTRPTAPVARARSRRRSP